MHHQAHLWNSGTSYYFESQVLSGNARKQFVVCFVLFCRVLQFLKLLSLYLTSSIHCFPVGQTLLLLLLVRLLNSSLHCHQGGVRVFLLFCHKERIHLSHDYFKLSQTKIKIVDCYINYTKLLHKIINYRVFID